MKRACLFFAFNFIVACAVSQSLDSLNPKKKQVNAKAVNGSLMSADFSIVQNISKSKEYSILSGLISSAGYQLTLESKGPLTFFAPVNSAFTRITAGKLDSLRMPQHKYELISVIAYHAVAGRLSARDIAKNIREHKGTAQFTTLAGTKLLATFDPNRNIILTDETGGRCTISQFDVEQSNGILHVVNGVFIPKAKLI